MPEVTHPAPVVVGVDGSAGSQLALGFGFAFADRRHLPLVAVHAWREFTPHTVVQVLTEAATQQDLADGEQRLLAEALAGWSPRYPDVPVSSVVRREWAVDALLAYSPRAELLVVASRGHGGFTGMLLGSTSQALVRYGSGPIAVVHPAAETADTPAEQESVRAGS